MALTVLQTGRNINLTRTSAPRTGGFFVNARNRRGQNACCVIPPTAEVIITDLLTGEISLEGSGFDVDNCDTATLLLIYTNGDSVQHTETLALDPAFDFSAPYVAPFPIGFLDSGLVSVEAVITDCVGQTATAIYPPEAEETDHICEVFMPNPGDTIITLSQLPAQILIVNRNGDLQIPGVEYTQVGADLVFVDPFGASVGGTAEECVKVIYLV